MSFYNMLFGMNGQADLLLAVIGLRKVDVERFRDVRSEDSGQLIEVYTRTGGGNREGYPQEVMRARPEWAGSEDDDYDSTYCTDTFKVPERWQADVHAMRDILAHGMRAEFAQHLAATLRREPTDADKSQAAYDSEAEALRRTRHVMANGHTFVPYDDTAAKAALDLAEKNGGSLRSCWGILPLKLTVKRDHMPYPKAPQEDTRLHMTRLDISYEWETDEDYLRHMVTRWASSHPLTMAKVCESAERHKPKPKP